MMEWAKSTDGILMQKVQPFPRACFTASQSMMTNMLCWCLFWWFVGFFGLFFFSSLYHSFLLLPFPWHIQGFALHCSPVTRFMLCLSAEMLFEPKPYIIQKFNEQFPRTRRVIFLCSAPERGDLHLVPERPSWFRKEHNFFCFLASGPTAVIMVLRMKYMKAKTFEI